MVKTGDVIEQGGFLLKVLKYNGHHPLRGSFPSPVGITRSATTLSFGVVREVCVLGNFMGSASIGTLFVALVLILSGEVALEVLISPVGITRSATRLSFGVVRDVCILGNFSASSSIGTL